jgi:hypothetical protein
MSLEPVLGKALEQTFIAVTMLTDVKPHPNKMTKLVQ